MSSSVECYCECVNGNRNGNMIDNGNGNENEKGRERKVNLINLVKDKKPVFGLDIVERQVPGLVFICKDAAQLFNSSPNVCLSFCYQGKGCSHSGFDFE